MNWSIPRMWEGRTVAVLASGPSMSSVVASTVRVAAIPAIVVNETFRLAPWADLLYAADEDWWKVTPEAMQFSGMKVSVAKIPGVRKLINTGVTGFDPDPACIRTGGNSGYQAIHIAAHCGASRILLCGFDMHGNHWHPEHKHPLKTTPQETYPRWCSRFEVLAVELKDRGVTVLNCTPGSALKVFPMADLNEALSIVEEQA